MPSKYPILKPSVIISILEEFDFKYVSQKGSHIKYSNGEHVVIIPNHSEVARGTLRSILNQANISIEDFISKM